MLASQRVTCEAVLCSDPREDVLSNLGIYSLPAVLIFDDKGELLHRFDGMVDYEGEVFPLLESAFAS